MGVKVEPPFCWPGAAQSVPRERIEFSKGEERREEAPPFFGREMPRTRERSRVENPDRYSGIIAARTMRCYQSSSGKPTLIRERIFAARPRLDVFLSACDRE